MVIKDSLKLNRFKMVRIPRKGELYRQYGEINGQQTFSGDELAETGRIRKSDAYGESERLMQQLDEKRQEEENNKPKKK